MWKKDCKEICSLLNRIYKIGVILSILLLNMILVSCSLKNSTDQMNNNGSKQEETEVEETEVENTEIESSTLHTDESTEAFIEKVEISMEEAIKIGRKEATKYYENLLLTEVHSYDNDYDPSIIAGENGDREWWYVNFGNEDLNYVNILIQNGEIIDLHNYDENWNTGLLNVSEIQMTSEEAAKRARAIGLCGGNPNNEEEWVSGYNFRMSYSSLITNTKDRRIFLGVVGISPNRNFAHVEFDAVTGELLLAEEKIEHEDGTVEWKSFN